MLSENTLDKLKQSTKEIDILCEQLSNNILEDILIDENESIDVIGVIDGCIKKVKRFVSTNKLQSGVSGEVTFAFAIQCIEKKDNKTAVSALKNLSKRGNIAAQTKLGEVSCFGLKNRLGRVEYQNIDYGISVLQFRIKKQDSEAAYQLGRHFKVVNELERAVFYFEKAYELGIQKVYPELLVLYKQQLSKASSYEEKLRLNQKISNIKSELIMK
ncbi:hypothetical protein [Vibrio crassostreae]|uniref:hypothetical protein n=1 Tax=Vibrio crassostreae TaxID=246167 RepID=UPI001B313169|nr:hypothetical protein [Vibrio crassostreae]